MDEERRGAQYALGVAGKNPPCARERPRRREDADVLAYLSSGWSASTNFFNNPDYTAQLKAAAAKIPHGVPVLVVIHSTNTDKKGKVTMGTTTMHSTNLVRSDIPASTFEIPAGYTKYEPPQQGAAAASASDASAQQDTTTKKKKHGLFHLPR